MKGTGPDRDRTLRTPGPWVAVQDPIDTSWRILHRLKDNNVIVALVADEGDAKLICEAVNLRASPSEAVERDAARYRWLRDHLNQGFAADYFAKYQNWAPWAADDLRNLDAAIDKSMSSPSAPSSEPSQSTR